MYVYFDMLPMSAPAANAFALPVTTIAPTPASASNASNARPSSSISASFSALSCLGRLSVTRPTRPRCSTRMFSYVVIGDSGGATFSVSDFRNGAQLVGRRRPVAEELEVGGNLLEQHVGADLRPAPALARGREQRRHFLLHHDFADERRGREARNVDWKRVPCVHA